MKSTYEPSEITNCGNAMFPRIDQENTYFTLKFCDEGIDYTNHLGRDIALGGQSWSHKIKCYSLHIFKGDAIIDFQMGKDFQIK